MPTPTVLFLVGEASGDHHAVGVVRALRERLPEVRMLGLGGPGMGAEGVELLAELDDLAVMGFAEVAARLPFFRRLEKRVRSLVEGGAVDLVIAVDYPGFNMRAARFAHAAGVPVLYYIAPQVWAWRAGRAAALARTTDKVAVILPFEERILREAGVDATFVGHPLLEREDTVAPRGAFCERWGIDPDRPILAILPGSRRQEIERHLETFALAAALVVGQRPEVQPVIGRAASLPQSALAAGLIVTDDTRALLRHARAALVKSGTSTLEATLEGTPFVVAYRTSAITWAVAKRVKKVEHVALTNLVAGARVVPEFLQERATPAALAEALGPLLDVDSPVRGAQLDALASVRASLGEPGASARVADLAVSLLRAPA